MKMTSATQTAPSKFGASGTHLAMWDFVKMFFGTVICGVVVSAVAAAIAILLAGDARASTTTVSPATAQLNDAFPGVLTIIGNCDADIVDAIERDWSITVNGNNIEVRVMQSFVVPEGDGSAATFHALLPPGARLLRLAAHTGGTTWQAKILNASAYRKLSATDFKVLSRKHTLIVQYDAGDIFTDASVNIVPGETMTIEYTYRVDIDAAALSQSLIMSLMNASHPSTCADDNPAIRGTVWVEWSGKLPAQISQVPGSTTLETSGIRITGLSWSSLHLDADQRFQLAWVM
jgi:hypothetical protein